MSTFFRTVLFLDVVMPYVDAFETIDKGYIRKILKGLLEK